MIKVEITVEGVFDDVDVKTENTDTVSALKTEVTDDCSDPNWSNTLMDEYTKSTESSKKLWHKPFEFVAANDEFKEVPVANSIVKMEIMEDTDGDISEGASTKSQNDSLENSQADMNLALIGCSPTSGTEDEGVTRKSKTSKLKAKTVFKDVYGKSEIVQQRMSKRKRTNEMSDSKEMKKKRVKRKPKGNPTDVYRTPNGIYSCPECAYASKCKRYLTVHMKQHDTDKAFSCNVCDYKCDFKKRLVHHMRTHTGEKPFSCNLCNYKCSFKQSLGVHMRTHTGEKPYSCNLCEFKCAQKSSLINHMGTHTGEKPFACHICEYKCMFKQKLILHMRTHTGEKPYSCSICEFKCAQRSSLVNHMGTHTGEKPFSCNQCDYRGRFKQTLIVHMRTHTGEKPYSCSLCQFKCAQNSNLVNHMRIHTGEKPFGCNICEFKCCRKKVLVSHMKSHAGKKTDITLPS